MRPLTLDHVAFWVADRRALVARCERHLAMHVIDEQDEFTLVGADARRGKLTFFDAEGPRTPGPLKHVGLRVSDLAAARALLPAGTQGCFELGEGLKVQLVEGATESEYDLDHVAFLTADPEQTATSFERYGLERRSLGAVEVGGAQLVFVNGDVASGETEKPLLNHLGLLVESAEYHRRQAEALGIEVESVVDAPNTYAVFVTGPDGIRIEYVEHKPTFALA
jgi:catechol 2,3-dioxygenase-like lactoylglutathione lyase family enzyme